MTKFINFPVASYFDLGGIVGVFLTPEFLGKSELLWSSAPDNDPLIIN